MAHIRHFGHHGQVRLRGRTHPVRYFPDNGLWSGGARLSRKRKRRQFGHRPRKVASTRPARSLEKDFDL